MTVVALCPGTRDGPFALYVEGLNWWPKGPELGSGVCPDQCEGFVLWLVRTSLRPKEQRQRPKASLFCRLRLSIVDGCQRIKASPEELFGRALEVDDPLRTHLTIVWTSPSPHAPRDT